jgi:regulator of nucleoside diphosphate kinase
MPYDALPIAADDAEALAALLHEVSCNLRPRTAATERLSEKLYTARIAVEGDMPVGVLRLGSAATYTELGSGVQRTVRVVVPAQADASAGRISVLSPIGSALIGLRAGATVEVELPTAAPITVRLDAVDHAPAREAAASLA